MFIIKKVELLSPAGDIESFYAAIEAGCDAVYLAGKSFGARQLAKNFTDEQLKEATDYAHLYNVKVYVTVNTIIYEREVKNFLKFIGFIHEIGVDAVILQDLGMMDLVLKTYPNLNVHLSTQVNIHNYQGALLAKKLGVKRIVMARETPLEVIKKIKEEIDIEVEVFIHGALCMCYSGQCLMSSLIGNRSANKGTCAQPCRKAYDLYNDDLKKVSKDKYLLSTKDLCTLEYLDKIIETGVDSLKIEGRMKRPYYVYLTTKVYKKAINNYYDKGKTDIEKQDIINLKKMYNRMFTKGFILGVDNNDFVYQKRPNHQGITSGSVIGYENGCLKVKLNTCISVLSGVRVVNDKKDFGFTIEKMYVNNKSVRKASIGDTAYIKCNEKIDNGKLLLTTDNNLIKEIGLAMKESKRKVLISVFVRAKIGQKLFLSANCGDSKVSVSSDFLIEEAKNYPISKDALIKQIKKTSSSVYKVDDINVQMDNNCYINIKDINDLRRQLLLKLDYERLNKQQVIKKDYDIKLDNFKKENKKAILLNTKEDYEKYHSCFDAIYTENLDLLKYDEVIFKAPRINDKYYDYQMILVSDFGDLIKYKSFDTDFSFNVVNSYTLAFLHSIGARKVTLSYELSNKDIKLLIENYEKRYKKHPNCEVIIDSYPEVMVTLFDLNKMYNIKNGTLVDEYNNSYKLVSCNNYMKIYNYKKVNENLPIKYYELGVNFVRYNKDR